MLDGFGKGALCIVRDRDRSSAIFRRFDTPSVRNLLYLEARVAALTAKQEEFDAGDFTNKKSDPNTQLESVEKRLSGHTDPIPHITDKELDEELSPRTTDLETCMKHPLDPLEPVKRGRFPFPLGRNLKVGSKIWSSSIHRCTGAVKLLYFKFGLGNRTGLHKEKSLTGQRGLISADINGASHNSPC
jgi:hypothetical protein